MEAGSLNRRVTIQSRDAGYDEAGQPVDTWTDVVSVWANVKGQTGWGSLKEMQGDIAASISRYSIRIRFREGLDAGMRVVYDGQYFDVKQVRQDMAGREWTDLVCEVGGSNG